MLAFRGMDSVRTKILIQDAGYSKLHILNTMAMILFMT